jgi:hypothetical protein
MKRNALGLSPDNNAVRDWEERGPMGPGVIALRPLRYRVEHAHMDIVRDVTSLAYQVDRD